MIKIDKPMLDKKTPEANIRVIEKWIAETTDKLNYELLQLERRINNGNTEDRSD